MRRGVRLKGIKRVTKPNGNVYVYRRVRGHLVPLPNLPENDPEFMQAYIDAEHIAGKPAPRAKTGSIGETIIAFIASRDYAGRKSSTRAVWQRILNQMAEKYGEALITDLKVAHINKDLARTSPGAARSRRTIWRALLSYAVANGQIEENPAANARIASYESKPFPPWTPQEISKYRGFWAVGTPERQAMEVMFWTGARCVDARILGWQAVEGGVLEFVQAKTGGTAVVPITASTHPSLEPDRLLFLDCIGKDMIWITTRSGRPRSQKALSQFLSAAAKKAGLPADRTAHGLRKSRAIALVHAGWTPHQIGAWTGHDSLGEIEDYTRGVNKKSLVTSAKWKPEVKQFPK